MDEDFDERLLARTSTHGERVRGLLAMGIHAEELASATNAAVSTLRNWSAGQSEPRLAAAVVLDNLRTTATVLLKEFEPARAARWMTSRDPERFDGLRPLDYIAVDPLDVLAAAHGDVEDERLRQEQTQHRARHKRLVAV